MFTGIVEGGAKVIRLGTNGAFEITLGAAKMFDGIEIGDSVSVNGVCLTATALGSEIATFEVMPETMARTTLGGLTLGSTVNVERPMKADGRFDGHLVQGHIDGTATLIRRVEEGASERLTFTCDSELVKYIVTKGSIALDGVSLTVTGVSATGFEVALIPHTLEVTTLGRLPVGGAVNVEIDVIAKYVERLLGDDR